MTLHVPLPGWLATRRWPQRLGANQCSVVAVHFAPEHFEYDAFTRYNVGSITHTGGWAAAAVLPASACRGLGIDLEVPVDEALLATLDSEIWDTHEARILRACPGLPMTVLGTLLFSAKESFYKALSAAAGRVFDFSAARLRSIDLSAGRMVLQTTETLAAGWPAGTRCTVDFTLLPEGLVMTAFAW